VLVFAIRRGMAPDQVRALGFLMLIGLNVALIFVNRTLSVSLTTAFFRPNRALSLGLGIVALLLAFIFGWPGARAFLTLGPLNRIDLAWCAAGLALTLLTLQGARLLWRGRLEQ